MRKEKGGWGENEPRTYARKWRSWYFASGKWSEANDELVEGVSRQEAVSAYGGYADAPMLSSRKQHDASCRDIDVYSLDARIYSDKEREQLQELRKQSDTLVGSQEYFAFYDLWEKEHPDLYWLDTWESVYPSAYMIFVDYMSGDDTIETHQIYCCTYSDLLQVLQMHA